MKPGAKGGHSGKHVARWLFKRLGGSNMKNEAQPFRRAFSIGLLTLGVAVGGQVATSQPASRVTVATMRQANRTVTFVHEPPRAQTCLAARVARAVIGAVFYSFS